MTLDRSDKEALMRTFEAFAESREPALRDQLIEAHLGLAEYLARRFSNRGEPLDDLIQVALLGILKAVERFDPERGLPFATFATPTVLGELKRHFRDRGWAVRPPRVDSSRPANSQLPRCAVSSTTPRPTASAASRWCSPSARAT